MISYFTGLSSEDIHSYAISSNTGKYISGRLRDIIRTRVRTANHFWWTQSAANPRKSCILCTLPLEHTPKLSGPTREIEFMACCFALTHRNCFQNFGKESSNHNLNCPSCQIPWTNWHINTSLDTIHTALARNKSIFNRGIGTNRRTFRKIATQGHKFLFQF